MDSASGRELSREKESVAGMNEKREDLQNRRVVACLTTYGNV